MAAFTFDAAVADRFQNLAGQLGTALEAFDAEAAKFLRRVEEAFGKRAVDGTGQATVDLDDADAGELHSYTRDAITQGGGLALAAGPDGRQIIDDLRHVADVTGGDKTGTAAGPVAGSRDAAAADGSTAPGNTANSPAPAADTPTVANGGTTGAVPSSNPGDGTNAQAPAGALTNGSAPTDGPAPAGA